ncbi:3-dehydroquinate synthase [Alienimonas californiensis]|uniref:3-dehydroquinate synthase n=1 Tax=Alienimonas californiensis TaxID=2527989 RepID=A0A517P6E2_9PLAN|nr:3-dehydroquinate synthase [Alienimonas californiensis]QDT14948.1 3-dehydroquinate synthase [Alienimonas californiensis]
MPDPSRPAVPPAGTGPAPAAGSSVGAGDRTGDRFDVPFTVPLTHRLRFTRDALGADANVLAALLESGEGEDRVTPKVQVWADGALANGVPGLTGRLNELLADWAAAGLAEPAGTFRIVGGEACKNDPRHVERVLTAINDADLDRRSYVLVLGGGAVLDAVGYAAAIAHRGVRLIRLPTTTLAQGDSGVGVKNAVNLFQKKNWQGTFAAPWAVVNDARLLETLPDRDFRGGFSECVKVSLLKSAEDFADLCERAEAIKNREFDAYWPALKTSCLWHLNHITAGGDPFEAREARPLDFGHWSAHRLEPLSGYAVRHGEAVGLGVALDVLYSAAVHGLPAADADRVLDCLAALGLPLWHPLLGEPDRLMRGLEEFRQHLGGRLTITLLGGVGAPVNVHAIDDAAMRQALRSLSRAASKRGATWEEFFRDLALRVPHPSHAEAPRGLGVTDVADEKRPVRSLPTNPKRPVTPVKVKS